MRINLYAQNRHTVVLDGVPLSEFSDGDFMTVKLDGNVAARTQGGDGPAMNISTTQGGVITLSLMPVSKVLGTIYQIRDNQKINPRLFTLALMTGVEEVITGSGCAFGDLPQFQTGGPTMQGRQFAIECLKITLDTSGVEALAGGFLGGLI